MINSNRLIDNFKKLVSLDSPSLNERKVCDFLKDYFNSIGVECFEDNAGEAIGSTAGNLYVYVDGDLKAEPILFAAHTDTVEPALSKKAVVAADGMITSDGTTVLGSDDLAGVVSILEALTLIKEKNIPHRPIEIVFSVCEEKYCWGMNAFDFGKLKSKQAYVFDLDGKVGTAAVSAPTILSYTAKFIGKSAHAGFASHLGVHAIKAACKAVCDIPCGNIAPGVSANVGIINGGKATNIVPDSCTIVGEIRSFDDADAENRYNQVKEICLKSAEELGAKADVDFTRSVTAFETDENSITVQRFKKACEKTGVDCVLQPTFGGSDNNVLACHGIEGIVVATAMNNCHTVNEYTSVEQLEKAAQLAYNLMISED